MLAAGGRDARPDAQTERRVWGMVLARAGEQVGVVSVPVAASVTALRTAAAVVLSVVLGVAGLGAVALVGMGWRSSDAVAAGPAGARNSSSEPVRDASVPTEGPEPVAAVVATSRGGSSPPRASASSSWTLSPRETTHRSAHRSQPVAAPPPPTAAEPARSEPSAAAEPVDPLAAQVHALRRAREALGSGDADRARSIVDAVTTAHPDGALAIELAVLRVDALCIQGQRDQAQRDARRLRDEHPHSPVAARAQCS